MKKNPIMLFLSVFLLILLCHFLYPHSRFGYHTPPRSTPGHGLNIRTATLAPGERISIHPLGIRRFASYSSSNSRIADVNFLGTVEAKRNGTAIIYVKHKGKTYHCRITVTSTSSHTTS